MNNSNSLGLNTHLVSDDSELAKRSDCEARMRRISIMCGLFETAYEIKSLELKRRNPTASAEWIHTETLRLIEEGTR